MQPGATPDAYRNREGRQIAGVSIALAEAFGVSVTFVRLAFIVLTFVNFVGPLIYLVLWVLLPAEPHGQSPLGQLVVGKDGKTSIFEQIIETITGFIESLVAWLRKLGATPQPVGEISTAEVTDETAEPPPPPPPPPSSTEDPDKPAEGAP